MEFIFLVLIFGFFFVILAYQSNSKLREQERIRAYLKSQEKEVVDIVVRSPSNGKGSSNVYDVTYMTPKNELYRTRCICWRQSELFWTEPVFVRQVSGRTARPLGPAASDVVEISAENATPNKEMIINGLTSGAVQECIAMVRQIGKLMQADELVLYILMDMSHDDPAIEVRKAAKETLQIVKAPGEITFA